MNLFPGFVFLATVALAASCGPTYPKCDEDSHCAEKGEVCVEGTCQQCRDETQCAAGQICAGGRCEAKPECSTDSDCTGNQVCRSGKCQTECTADGDCGSGMKCVNNRCKDELACSMDSDCKSGMSCIGGRCQTPVSRGMCQFPTVYFDFNDSNLSSSARSAIQSAADCIKQHGGRITIEGHADERGTVEYNLALADRRARSVQKYLTNMGVAANKLEIVSKGELEPADPGHDEAAWAKNRRAEFIE